MLVKPFEITLYHKLRLFFKEQGFVLMADKKQFRKVRQQVFKMLFLLQLLMMMKFGWK